MGVRSRLLTLSCPLEVKRGRWVIFGLAGAMDIVMAADSSWAFHRTLRSHRRA